MSTDKPPTLRSRDWFANTERMDQTALYLDLAKRVRDGIRDAGGIPIEFPVHPIFENCRRPTAALDRNLLYLGLVEILNGYPLDGVVLTTGCDKTTPAQIMG